MNRILIALIILVLSGCNTPAISVSADQRYLEAACVQIKMRTQDILQQKRDFYFDVSETKIGKPTDGVHGKSLEKFYLLDVLSYFTYANEHLLSPDAAKVKILSVEVEIGDNGVMAETVPVVFIKLRGRNASGQEFQIEKGATGPALSNWQQQGKRSAKEIESVNTAFLGAFLRTMLAIGDNSFGR